MPIYRDGEAHGTICPDAAREAGLTLLDLSNDWTPFIFLEDPSLGEAGEQPYRDVLLALANEDFDSLPDDVQPERFLELYGIFPTLPVLYQRLHEDERHACHEAVDDTQLALLTEELRPWGSPAGKERRVRSVAYLHARLERARVALELESIADLRRHEDHAEDYARYEEERIPVDAMRAVRAHLRCEGLNPRRERDGILDSYLVPSLIIYQRRHMVTNAGFLDAASRAAFLEDSRDADFQALLRTLRERVIDATGLIADGSALREWRMVMGRKIDTVEFLLDAGHPAVEVGAPDAISPATEAAAHALGFTDPSSATEALGRILEAEHEKVAVELPPLPAYHSAEMELRAEIHRGDVWYDYPYTGNGGRRQQPVQQRPIITLYTRHEGQDIALLRWATTIGGWKNERAPGGGTARVYKNSPVGPRWWRDVVASPAWIPPPSTPNDDLVFRENGGPYRPNRPLFGPSYRSAYGLVMLMHHRELPPARGDETGEPRFYDEGIRVHGSASYRSIVRGTSHGCHRLFNHLAVRLSSFVLRHRPHRRHGSMSVRYRRHFPYRGSYIDFRLNSRGYRYELTPPVRIEVLEGTIRGDRDEPDTSIRRL